MLTLAEPSSFARTWGLIAPEFPDREAGVAQIFWRQDAYPGVLSAIAVPGHNGDTVDFRMLPCAIEFPLSMFTPPPHAVWWSSALAAFDAAQMGLPRRQIAERLFGAEAVAELWLAESEWMRSRVRRALQMGKKLFNGGYRRIPSHARLHLIAHDVSQDALPQMNERPDL